MNPSLSQLESDYLADRDFLLAKRVVVDKNVALLYQLQEVLKEWEQKLPPAYRAITQQSREGKVSIGENYEGLPYQIFDFPRVFTEENTFALRTMIWWGHHISLVLHIGGEVWQSHKQRLLTNVLQLEDAFVGVADEPWEHHFRPSNFLKVSELSDDWQSKLSTRDFLKVGVRWDLSQREKLPDLVKVTANQWLSLF